VSLDVSLPYGPSRPVTGIALLFTSIMKWARHVERVGEKRNGKRILVGSQKERDYYEDLDVSGRIISRLILER
jgi:hypothetical protein